MAQREDGRSSTGFVRKPDFTPVQRFRAESYILIVLVSLAASVMGTRLFLALTGYPQIGGATLHIAHAIWGGLLLYAAALLPLILANGWAQTASAVLNGLGAGLFIDEVGKFITRDLDYFYPPAAPLVYAFFLLSVLLYRFVRRAKPVAPRTQLYHALEGLQEVLDGDMDQGERERVLAWLNAAARTDAPELARLATSLSVYLREPTVPVYPVKPNMWSRLQARVAVWGRRLGRTLHRGLLLTLLSALVVGAGLAVTRLVLTALEPGSFREALSDALLAGGNIRALSDVTWYLLRVVLDAGVALAALAAIVTLLTRGEDAGTRVAVFALAFSLTTVTLLNFYLDQFGAALLAVAQFGMLLVIVMYRQWYILPELPPARA